MGKSKDLINHVRKSKPDFLKMSDALDLRFPDSKFVISCFDNIDEIENKVLTEDEHIIITDCYKTEDGSLHDAFVVNKRADKSHIYYCDVIDELMKNDFIRNDCRFKFLESIGITNKNIKTRNSKSVKTYGIAWGS